MNKGFAAWAARARVPLGFAWGLAYLVFAQPTARMTIFGGAVALLGVLLRTASAGSLEKSSSLATAGPYRYTRNPLYLGSFLMGGGFALAGGSWALGLSFVALFFLIYGTVMLREAAFLRRQFGDSYERYARAVPLFIPVPGMRAEASSAEAGFSWKRYRKNHEHEAALGYLVALLFLVLKMWLR